MSKPQTLALIEQAVNHSKNSKEYQQSLSKLQQKGIIILTPDGPEYKGTRIHFGFNVNIRDQNPHKDEIFIVKDNYLNLVCNEIDSEYIYTPRQFFREYELYVRKNIISADFANFWLQLEDQTSLQYNNGNITSTKKSFSTAYIEFFNFLISRDVITKDMGTLKLGRNRKLVSNTKKHSDDKAMNNPKELDNGMYIEVAMSTARKKIIISKIIQSLIDGKPLSAQTY